MAPITKVFITFLLFAVWPPPAAAADNRPKAAVLPFDTVGLSDEWGLEHLSVLSEELAGLEIFQLLPMEKFWPQLGGATEKLKEGCLEDVACVNKTGKKMKVDYFVHLLAEKTVEGITFTMRLMEVRTGRQVRKVSDFATGESSDQARAIRWLIRMVCSPLIAPAGSENGKLLLSGDLAGAEIFINGKRFEPSPEALSVEAGSLDVVVRRKEHLPFHDVVVVRPGQRQQVVVALQPLKKIEPLPPPVPDQVVTRPTPVGPPEPPPFYKRWWFWTIIGAAVAGAGGVTAYFLLRGGPSGQGDVAATWK